MYYDTIDISILIGKTLTSVVRASDDDKIEFTADSGEQYILYHQQDCCESVSIDDIEGDLNDLVGSPITMAEEVGNDSGAKDKYDKSFTWTFYKLATVKGYVTIKWYGTSNGYYSESVDFSKIN